MKKKTTKIDGHISPRSYNESVAASAAGLLVDGAGLGLATDSQNRTFPRRARVSRHSFKLQHSIRKKLRDSI